MKFLNTIRYSEWWVYKLCPLLAIGYATILMGNKPFLQASFYFIFLLASMIVGTIYVCLINDITDMKEDLACGKSNRMAGIPAKIRWVFPVLCLLAGSVFFFYLYLQHDLLSFILYPLPCIAFSLYSFEPFRLKRRGFWGVLADASGSHLFPSLYFVSAMSHFTGQQINWLWFSAIGVWALCYGLRGILWHQFRDRDNDRQVGLKTYVSSVDIQTLMRQGIIIFSLEMAALSAMLFIIREAWCFVFLVFYAIVVLFRYKILGQQIILIQTPKVGFQILMIDYYQVFMPLSLLIVAVTGEPAAIWVLAFHILLFPQKIWCIFKDLFFSLRRFMLQRI
jgi:4-hydroxybenzoate polyprenyltransferase